MTVVAKQPEELQAAKQPPVSKKSEGKKMIPLTPGDYVERCSWILPNKLQCWKAGEERVSVIDKEGNETHYQLCERHARIQKALDAGTLKPETIDTPMKEMLTEPPYTAEPAVEETEAESKTPTKTEEEKDKDSGKVEDKDKVQDKGTFFKK